MEYSIQEPFWANLYGKVLTYDNRGPLSMNHKLFHPRLINADSFYDAPNVDLELGYKSISNNIKQLSTIEDINKQLRTYFNIRSRDYLDMSNFVTIHSNGKIETVKKWIIEAYYEYENMYNH
jgi:hypothetical protein